MNSQYNMYIRGLSTTDLLAFIENTKYAALASAIEQYEITGNDLLELHEFDLIRKFGNNVNRKMFAGLLITTQTTPYEIFSLPGNTNNKPCASNIIEQQTELHAVFAKRNTQQQKQSSQFHTHVPIPESCYKANIFTKPAGGYKPQQKIFKQVTTNKPTVQNARRQSFVSNNEFDSKPNVFTSGSLPRSKRHEINASVLNAQLNQSQFKGVPKIKTPALNWNEKSPQPIRKASVPEISNKQEEKMEVDENNEDLPVYINTSRGHTPTQSEAYSSFPDLVYTNQQEKESKELPAYANTDVEQNIDYPNLNDPKVRQQLEIKLQTALFEIQNRNFWENQPEHAESENANNHSENIYSNSPDSFDSFDEALAQDSFDTDPTVIPPPLPDRPPELLTFGTVRKIKARDSSGPIAKATNADETTTKPIVDHTHGQFPPGIPAPLSAPIFDVPDDNNYEQPVTLNSPEFVLRRIKFFREVTRDQARDILIGKPIGTFLIRPSNKFLAVLMFVGKSMFYNLPICYDNVSNAYYLAAAPGVTHPKTFKNMSDLLDFYSNVSPCKDGQMILSVSANNLQD